MHEPTTRRGAGGRRRRARSPRRRRRPTWRDLAAAGAAAGLIAAAPAAADDWPPAPEALTDGDVRAAIDVIASEMLATFDPRHGWDPARWTDSWGSRSQSGGYTALAALALVQAGVSVHEPSVARAIDLVRRAELPGTYAVATRACLLTRLPPDRRDGLARDVERLLRGFHLDVRGWNYRLEETWGRRDNSLRQFGALALWDASAAGIPVPERAWLELDLAFLDAQRPDGGWNYRENDAPARGSMTAAAIATLLVTDDRLAGIRAPEARELAARRRTAIDRGLAWLDRHFDPSRNPGTDKWWFYYAYSIERVGLATGRVRIGGRDWFRELAHEALARTCRRDASGTLVLRRDRRNRVDDLAFALMLLTRGRVPLVAGKLVVPEAASDARPRDVAAVARVVGTAMERELGWRRVALDEPVEDWLSVPMLVLVGSDPLPPPDTPIGDRLRARTGSFLDAGGWLLVVDTGRGRLGRDVADLVAEIRPRAAADRADREHPAFTFHRPLRRRLPVRIVSDGVRDLAVIVRGDDWLPPLAVTDARPRRRGRDRAPADPRATVLLNLALAATADGPPRPRLAARPGDPRAAGRAVLESTADAATERSLPPVRIRRLRHGGHWDAVPGAEPAFAAWAEAARRLAVTPAAAVSLDAAAGDALGPGDLLLVAGVDAPDPSAARRIAEAVAAAARAGATVLLTTAGGRAEGFSRAVEHALPAAGCTAPARGPARAVLESAPWPVASVRWTHALRETLGPRATEPRVRAARAAAAEDPAPDAASPRAGHRAGSILVSHEDVLVGVLGRGAWGVRGYAPASARDVLAAVASAASGSASAVDDADGSRMPPSDDPAPGSEDSAR